MSFLNLISYFIEFEKNGSDAQINFTIQIFKLYRFQIDGNHPSIFQVRNNPYYQEIANSQSWQFIYDSLKKCLDHFDRTGNRFFGKIFYHFQNIFHSIIKDYNVQSIIHQYNLHMKRSNNFVNYFLVDFECVDKGIVLQKS